MEKENNFNSQDECVKLRKVIYKLNLHIDKLDYDVGKLKTENDQLHKDRSTVIDEYNLMIKEDTEFKDTIKNLETENAKLKRENETYRDWIDDEDDTEFPSIKNSYDKLKEKYKKLKGDHSVYISLVSDHTSEIDELKIESDQLKKQLHDINEAWKKYLIMNDKKIKELKMLFKIEDHYVRNDLIEKGL